jgi:hypothetical protein
MTARLLRLWRWLKAHIVPLTIEKDARADVKGGGVGFRFWF